MQALVRTVRRSFARLLFHSFARFPQRAVAALVIAALLTPAFAHAKPRPLDPGTVHVRILKRGVGNFIALQQQDGIQLFGRILAIGGQSFTLQLHNDPQTTEVFYADVAYLRTGFTAGEKVFMFSGIAATAGFGIWGFVHIHNLENKPLQPPPPIPPLAILQ
jgi:hypothetical protein